MSWRECPVVLEREVLEREVLERCPGESVLERSPGGEGGPSGVERVVLVLVLVCGERSYWCPGQDGSEVCLATHGYIG